MSAVVQKLRPLVVGVALGWMAAPPGPRLRAVPAERSAALAAELRAGGLETGPDEVHWLDAIPGPLASRVSSMRALVRGRRSNGVWDVYLARARVSPEGSVLGLDGVFDLTRTSAAAEERLVTAGRHAAWTIGDAARTYRVELADVDGETLPAGEGWNRLQRVQRAIAEWQRTGQSTGVGRRSFKLEPAAKRIDLTADADHLVIVADDHRIVIPWDRSKAIDGQRFIREEEREIARPGNVVTWAVDRARDLSWLGDERMQWTKAIAYAALDRLDRALGTVRAPEPEDTKEEGLGGATTASTSNPETGWPPPPLEAPEKPALPDEGKWLGLDRDPFVRTSPAVPSPLVTTYLRADAERPESRVYVVEWDPRQVELDVVPGTEEPQSATGETGNGMIPRTPEVLPRVVAAFNGGFQSTHGDFGMMADGAVLVPPKPYAATVARLEGGVTAFGTWPEDPSIPKDVVSLRQNLTPLVANGKFNPYGREWWGGVPHDWEDETHTVRSGICRTREGFVAYFYGTKIDHKHLGRAMLAARCDYGVHLDMNQGHTGLELYRVDRAEVLPPISGKLDGHWQTEGDVLGMPGYRFRGRRLVRNLQLMHFPRYIRRGARDYFYLMLRPLLPHEPLARVARAPGEGEWNVSELPQHGWPNAIATTEVRPDPARPETKVRVLAMDPAMLRPAGPGDEARPTVLSIAPASSAGSVTLWLAPSRGATGDTAPEARAVRLASGEQAAPANVAAGACIDGSAQIVYAEVVTAADPAHDASVLGAVFDAVGCTQRLYFPRPLSVALGGTRNLSDHPVRPGPDALRLVRAEVPGSRALFPETPVKPPAYWQPLQRQTRWFPKEPEPASSGSAGEATAVTSSAAASPAGGSPPPETP